MKNSTETLDFWTCFFLDSEFHHPNPLLSIDDENDDVEKLEVRPYKCKAIGRYLTGNDAEGELLCGVICGLIFLIGLCGVVTNTLNILILRNTFSKGLSFKEPLLLLAVIELVLCVFTILFAVLIIVVIENVDRSEAVLELFRVSNIIASFARTGSIYVTILITVERYIAVAHPVKSKLWLQPRTTRTVLISVVVFSFLVNLPWMLKSSVEDNVGFYVESEEYFDTYDISSFPYIYKRTPFAKMFYRPIQEILLALNYVVPLPLLLIINGLLYKSIYSWNKNRAALSGQQRKDINAARMFSVVVIVLVLCHSVSCIVHFTSRVLPNRVIYRELLLLQSLSIAFGAGINFVIYYRFGQGFQRECKKLLEKVSCSREVITSNLDRKPSAISEF